ncbi:L,D-transpeptidase family protein [Luteibaculum oceani]|uniref:L,D-transpeptidase family protein n=1 Tax=Luteibaculum oceani TaxID=1294296 RepID=A0A5C6V5J1_9FLAO|nr:L,D-transpeptidase family protein [Luteibaculum oceani]TXC78915.1 L,D-transpeptidase family protein [Luteibaculum oceani]
MIVSLVLVILFLLQSKLTPELDVNARIDRIEVYKSQRVLKVFSGDKELKSYSISLGFSPRGDKQIEGDGKTPEGKYFIDRKNPKSAFYLNLGVSYPTEEQKLVAQKEGRDPGGLIKIHGLQNGWGWMGRLHLLRDWTAGCIALTNGEIKELYDHVPVGTPIFIYP